MTDAATFTAAKDAAMKTGEAVHFFAVADMLEEDGADALAYAWRWMGRSGVRPGDRSPIRSVSPWVWYGEPRSSTMNSKERSRAAAMPWSWLPKVVWVFIRKSNMQALETYETADDAIHDLAVILDRMRAVLEVRRDE